MKIKLTYLLSFLLSALLLTNCKSTETINSDTESEIATVIIAYEQNAGNEHHSPEYKIEVYTNQQMFLNGIKNIDKEGKYMRTLSKEEYSQLIKAFMNARFFDFEDIYGNMDTTKSKQLLTFKYHDKSKTVNDFNEAPEALTELEFLIKSYLDRVGWSKMSW